MVGTIGLDGQTTSPAARKGRKGASDEFRQAAIMTFLVDEILKTGKWATRLRVQKHLYFAIEIGKLQVKANFTRKAGGMYDSTLKYKGGEGIAIRNGYLTQDHGRFDRGPKLQAALVHADHYIGDHRAAIMELIQHFVRYKDETIGRWSTVHDAARQIIAAAEEPTVERVKAVLQAEREWKKKLALDEYSDHNIQNTLTGLKNFGFLEPSD